ncbi:hypothetical protein C1H46_000323 [Malus baccata]|uniref:Uncharacterized protein n=1 Tax=Malus baccata TaxID=106549 RepID=A0A540NSP6_MALBA|nr:hypothetical protein C1H46_000323 [Malus baccata]
MWDTDACARGSAAATSPLDMGTTGVPQVTPLGPTVSTAPASSTSSVMHHFKKKRGPCRLLKTSQTTCTTTEKITITWNPRHRAAVTKEQHSALASNIGSIIRNHWPLLWESWKAIPPEVKEVVLHELSHYEKYDGPEVALVVGCLIELVDCPDEWEWLYDQFQDEKYLKKKVKANSINRSKKKLFHRFGSRRFSYRLKEGCKIDMFKEVYIRRGNELAEQLHSTMVEKGQIVLEEVASQLPLKTLIKKVFPS